MEYITLVLLFAKVSLLTFGSGLASLPFLYQVFVVEEGWLTTHEFSSTIALAQMTPGPIILNSATLIGYRKLGFAGSILGTASVVVAPLMVVMLLDWIFKSAFAILIVTNTWNIVMGVFDATQQVVNQSAGVIIGDTSIDFDTLLPDLESRLEAMDIGPLLGLWFQTLVVGLTMNILSICIFLVTYGRMIEIYAVTALGPIPLATLGNAEWRGMGQNYLKSLLALGFQAFLIMVVVGIYAVLIQQIGTADDISGAIWGCMGYTVLLCFCLFKTGSISKAVFTAH